jgi:hypothetical protein
LSDEDLELACKDLRKIEKDLAFEVESHTKTGAWKISQMLF